MQGVHEWVNGAGLRCTHPRTTIPAACTGNLFELTGPMCSYANKEICMQINAIMWSCTGIPRSPRSWQATDIAR